MPLAPLDSYFSGSFAIKYKIIRAVIFYLAQEPVLRGLECICTARSGYHYRNYRKRLARPSLRRQGIHRAVGCNIVCPAHVALFGLLCKGVARQSSVIAVTDLIPGGSVVERIISEKAVAIYRGAVIHERSDFVFCLKSPVVETDIVDFAVKVQAVAGHRYTRDSCTLYHRAYGAFFEVGGYTRYAGGDTCCAR